VGEPCVTTDYFRYFALLSLKLLRGCLRTRHSQKPRNIVNTISHVRHGFTYEFGLGNRGDCHRTKINKKVELVKSGERNLIRLISQYHDDCVTMTRDKLQSLNKFNLSGWHQKKDAVLHLINCERMSRTQRGQKRIDQLQSWHE